VTEHLDPAERLRKAAVALGDRTRFMILSELLAGPLRVGDLVDRLALAQPLVSHHLSVLGEAGWVTKDGANKRGAYRLRLDAGDPIGSMLRLLIDVRTVASSRSGPPFPPQASQSDRGPQAPSPQAPRRAAAIEDFLL